MTSEPSELNPETIEDQITPFILVDCSSRKEAEVERLILESQQQVESIVNQSLKLEVEGIQREFGIHVQFRNIADYFTFLVDNRFVTKDKRKNTRFEQSIKLYLARHWEKAKDQVNRGLNGVRSWDDFWKTENFHSTPSGKISFASEAKMYPYELTNSLMMDDIIRNKDYGRTAYVTHTSAAIGIMNERQIRSPGGANFSCSAVVFKYDDENYNSYIFKTSDLIRAVPMVFSGNSTTGGEQEITTWFPVPLGLARTVVPIKHFLKDINYQKRSGYYQAQLSPEMFMEKVD